MSVTLLLQDQPSAPSRLLPIATQERFVSSWMPAIEALRLEWIGLAVTGFFVTEENRGDVVRELQVLHDWFLGHGDEHAAARLAPVIGELTAFRFESGASAYLG